MADLVLICPPVSLPSEPPLGVATLAAAMRAQGLEVQVVDACIEGLEHLWSRVPDEAARDTAERRALRLRGRALEQLRSSAAYTDRDRHHAAVGTLRRLLRMGRGPGRPDLAAYHDPALSPLSSADLRAAARGHRDSPFAGYYRELARRVADLSPRAVGLSINYLDQALPAMALAGTLREHLGSSVQLLVGGGLVRCWEGRLAARGLAPAVDRLVFGDGTAALLEALGRGDPAAQESAPPDYAGMPWELYLAPERVVPFATTRGCYWSRCRHCPEAALGEPFSSPFGDALVPTLRRICHDNGSRIVHLTDSAIPPANLERLEQIDGGLRWYGFVRFHEALADVDRCRRLKRAGCVMLQLGLESGSRRVLRRLGKGIDPDLASQVLSALHRAGIATYVYVMFGTPGEQRTDAEQTLRFLVDHADRVGFLNVSLLNLPRDTPGEPCLVTHPLDGAGDLSLYVGFEGDGGWQRREARRFVERELRRHPRVAEILRRTPHVLGANHAPFFAGSAHDPGAAADAVGS